MLSNIFADYRRDVAAELAGPQIDPGRFVASTLGGAKAQDACGDRPGQQDGADDLGVDDKGRGLSRFGAGSSCIINMQQNLPDAG